jgi:ATP-binding cassette subfamily F protein uup
MHILSVEAVSKDYGLRPILENVSLGFDSQDRIGVVGINGSGKTTFLRLVAGEESPDAGRITFADGVTVGYLPQNPPYDADATVLEAVFAANDARTRLLLDYERACGELAAKGVADQRALDRVSELGRQLEASGAWELETNARTVLGRLGINDTNAKMGALSGGQRKRVSLAHALIERPGLLILDEPTNHLDAETISWLEDYLNGYGGALLLVTHDRYFLDRVTTRILEVDGGAMRTYDGSYAYYLEKKEEEEAARAVEGQKREMLIRRELAWLRRGAKARTRKSKARVERAEQLIAQPRETTRAALDMSVGSTRLGKKVLELRDITKSYDGRVLIDGYSRILKPGERIGVIGPNGAGKTTLLEIIAGRVAPDAGSLEVGQTVRIGYYDQESRALDERERVIDYIRAVAERVETADGSFITASQMLDRFLFTGAMQYAPIAKLSGGERRRLYLLHVLMAAPNLLLLDEPTNDLDIQTLMVLEDYLDGFNGNLIVVSHDRYFLDRTVEHVIRFEGVGRLREYPGNYSAFLEARRAEESDAAPARPVQAAEPAGRQSNAPPTAKRKLTFKERKELEETEARIQAAELREAEIERELSVKASDAHVVHRLYEERAMLTEQLARDLERWAELAEYA